MDAKVLKSIADKGEDSFTQFKRDVKSPDALAAEIVSFLNAKGGTIHVGVADDGSLAGLSHEDVRRINQMISNVASQHVKNPVSLLTENSLLPGGRVIVSIHVSEGRDKPYFDGKGVVWVREGADKRRVVSREEIRRFFEASSALHADEQTTAATIADLDIPVFSSFFAKVYASPLPPKASERARILRNLNLADESGRLNLAGLLLFGKNTGRILPQFGIKAVAIKGKCLESLSYDDSEDYAGTLPEIYRGVVSFINRNLHKRQTDAGFNAPGQSEIHPTVIEEIMVNALVHRDYFVDAPIRVLLFDDRVEVVSPGSLPNHLTVEKILAGNTNIRNPILASFVAKGVLPYHGLGSGIMRSASLCPGIRFEDDRSGVQFKVSIPRGSMSATTEGRKEIVVSELRKNPKLSLRALAKTLGTSLSMVQEYVSSLKVEGRISREGGTRGVWIVSVE